MASLTQFSPQIRELPRDLPTIALAVLKCLPRRVVVVDATGRVVSVNDAWVAFVQQIAQPSLPEGCNVGDDYFGTTGPTAWPDAMRRDMVREGIAEVLCGARKRFEYEYSLNSSNGEQWFTCEAVRLSAPHSDLSVLIHSEITEQKRLRDLVREVRWRGQLELGEGGEKQPPVDLTERQRQVLEMLSQGCSYREISTGLGIAQKTVEYHVSTLKEKFGCSRTVALIRQATEQHLI